MYFLTYERNSEVNIGILRENKDMIIPLKNILNNLGRTCPATMIDFVRSSDDALIEEMCKQIELSSYKMISKEDVKICPPIPNPQRNVMCIGKNYRDHVKELRGKTLTDTNVPDDPVYFTKSSYSVIGDKEVVRSHSHITSHIDYEVELAVIIGKDGINIPREKAEEYIFGYTIANDITARNIQKGRNQWFKGKSLDTFCPMGPYILHKSKVSFPVELDISCKINGETRQRSNTRNMIFDISYIISDLSMGMELRAGDIILTGTPSGVGFGFQPPKFLKSGDVVECCIEKIGTLTNSIE